MEILDSTEDNKAHVTLRTLPGVSDRVKAVTADTVILIVMMYIFSVVFSQFEDVPDAVRILGFVFVFILYDPLLTSLLGGTLGHMMMNLKVKRKSDEGKNLSIFSSIPRYLIKVILGWLSLLTVGTSRNRLAIHDKLTGSIVLFRSEN